MGWRGTMRSIGAAVRAAERDAQRRHRAAVKMQALVERDQRLQLSAQAVDAWEEYVASLVSVHVDLADAIDWAALALSQKPPMPVIDCTRTNVVEAELSRFRPSFGHLFQGGAGKVRLKLEQRLLEAKCADETDFRAAQESYPLALQEWESEVAFANRVLAGDEQAWIEVIKEHTEFTQNDLIGSRVTYKFSEGRLHAVVAVHDDSIVPAFERRLLASGKHSEKKMTVGRFNEMYQDYVASVALKVAGDTFHILPTNEVWVTCVSQMLNSATGHKAATPILSVQFVRQTFINLNLRTIDPSDGLRNFRTVMDFKKTKGFGAIEPLLPV